MHLHRWGSAKKVAPDGQGGRIFAKEEKAKGWRMPYGRKRPSSAPAKPAVANAAAGEAQQVAVASCEATLRQELLETRAKAAIESAALHKKLQAAKEENESLREPSPEKPRPVTPAELPPPPKEQVDEAAGSAP